jgi:hypothetical protein
MKIAELMNMEVIRKRTRRFFSHRAVKIIASLLVVYLVVAYSVMPLLWEEYTHHRPRFENQPTLTHTGAGIPGDPLNIGAVGSETTLKRAMLEAGWYPADPLTLRSSIDIAADTVLRRTYDEAPVSNLYLFGRREDLAFEKPVGHDPRRRHHVRFWNLRQADLAGRPAWIGAVTFDVRVGLSHTTGQITHHISGDIDGERTSLVADLRRTSYVSDSYLVPGFQPKREGKNGGGDVWHTDGNLAVVIFE